MSALNFVVTGVPVQKGSMRAFARLVNGKPVATVTGDNRKELRSWQHAVGYEAARAGAKVCQGAVTVRVRFRFLRPPSVSVKQRPSHTVKPDIDKLVRAVLDGLTGVAFRDDAQVVSLTAVKEYGERAECVVDVSEVVYG